MKVILPTKAYQLFFEHRPEYLYVYIGCETNSLEIARSYWFEIMSLLFRRGYRHILIDKDVAKALPAEGVHLVIEQLSRTGYNKVALSICDRYYDKDRCDFEQFAANDCGIDLNISPTIEEAETWLLTRIEQDQASEEPAPPRSMDGPLLFGIL